MTIRKAKATARNASLYHRASSVGGLWTLSTGSVAEFRTLKPHQTFIPPSTTSATRLSRIARSLPPRQVSRPHWMVVIDRLEARGVESIEGGEIGGIELDLDCRRVLLEVCDRTRPRNQKHPLVAGQQPG